MWPGSCPGPSATHRALPVRTPDLPRVLRWSPLTIAGLALDSCHVRRCGEPESSQADPNELVSHSGLHELRPLSLLGQSSHSGGGDLVTVDWALDDATPVGRDETRFDAIGFQGVAKASEHPGHGEPHDWSFEL